MDEKFVVHFWSALMYGSWGRWPLLYGAYAVWREQSSGKAVKVSKRRWVTSKLDLLTQRAVKNG